MSTTTGSFSDGGDKTVGWVTFAAMMLGIAGMFNVIDGIVALSKSKFYVANASYVFSDLHTWGWIILIAGSLELLAAAAIFRGSEFARWFGVTAASINALAQLMFEHAYPLWTLAAFTMDILIIYALVVYAGSRLKTY